MNQSIVVSRIKTPKADIEIHNDGILRMVLNEGMELTLQDRTKLKQMLHDTKKSVVKMPMILRLSPSSSIKDPEVRTSDDCSESSPLSGVAILTSNLSQRLAAIAYARAFRSVFPVEVFSDEEHAKAWLHTLQWHSHN